MYFFFLVNPLILLRFLTGIWAKDYLQEEKSLQDICSTNRHHQHGWQIIKAGSLEDTAQPADSSASQRVTFLGGCLGASSRQFPLVSASAGQLGLLLWEWLFAVFTVCMLLGKEGPVNLAYFLSEGTSLKDGNCSQQLCVDVSIPQQ